LATQNFDFLFESSLDDQKLVFNDAHPKNRIGEQFQSLKQLNKEFLNLYFPNSFGSFDRLLVHLPFFLLPIPSVLTGELQKNGKIKGIVL
jgi:hypothetical protein